MIRCLRLLLGVVGLLCAGARGGAGSAPPADAAADMAARARLIARATTALSVGDRETARAAIETLRSGAGDPVVAAYLEARWFEAAGAWEEALRLYRAPLADAAVDLSTDWLRLLSGRWVRAELARDASWVRAIAAQGGEAPRAGRCLILPPEVLVLEAPSALARPDTEALSRALAAWVVIALRQIEGAEPVSARAAALLTRGTGILPGEGRVTTLADEEDEALAPVTSTIGIAQRLARLEPTGPPPWSPDAPRPGRFFSGAPSGQWTPEMERALAHFQREHGLAPTGIPDAETRQALERAYRQARTRLRLPTPADVRTDPILAAGRLAGAQAVLTGTLEPFASGALAWELVWIDPKDGALLCDPQQGTLAREHFDAAWTHMLTRVLASSPFCSDSPACGESSVPPAPSFEGAVLYGAALQALEQGREADAARLFSEAAAQGAGEGARWHARAWSADSGQLQDLERAVLERAMLGPARLDPGLLQLASTPLAGDLWRQPRAAGPPALVRRDAALAAFPDHGWIHVSGQVE